MISGLSVEAPSLCLEQLEFGKLFLWYRQTVILTFGITVPGEKKSSLFLNITLVVTSK